MQLEIISGTVEHVTFYNADNGYSVLKIVPDNELYIQNNNGTLTVVGNFPGGLQKGESAEFEGYWVENPQYGTQFKVMGFERIRRVNNPPAAATSPASTGSGGTATLRGTIERITFYNAENGWGVVKVVPDDDSYPEEAMSYDGLIAVVGVMPELVEGESAEFTGRWVNNEQYGKQFKAEQVVPIAPKNRDGIVHYIADTVFGIGQVTANRIYDHFGDQTLEILDTNPERIHDVPGLKPNLAKNLIDVWSSGRQLRQIMVHLQSYGITSRLAKRIYDEYGNETLQIVQTDPYQLADDVHGIGFKKADKIAQGMGIAPESPARLRAGLVYTLRQMANDGHTYAPRELLIETGRELLGVQVDDDVLDLQIREQVLAGKIRRDTLTYKGGETDAIYLPLYHGSERGTAALLKVMANAPSKILYQMKETDWSVYLAELAQENNVKLTEEQQGAVKAALTSKISVLTGGPGTGKTTTLRMVINALDQEGYDYQLASPTGRAAKRLAEATGREARTIHRLLGWNPQEGGFEHDEDSPLDADVVIIDESSMIDLLLFYNLLKALKVSTHLMLVGDVDQLPSVGAGNVLNDVIASGIASVTRLSQIFRQEDASHIITNAHRINHGQMPVTDNASKDFFFFAQEEPVQAAELVVDIVVNRLEKKLGAYDRVNDVQVIAPMYRGPIGVNALNEALQEALNPASYRVAEKRLGGRTFRHGDKVMQTKNNYEKDVFNGDIGIIYGIHDDENSLEVTIDGRNIVYDFVDAEEQLIHAYCISTHRSQGSEYPVVVMPVMTQHYMMLQRNLLYTAITRAKQMVVLVGTRKAVAIAVENNKVAERYSGLMVRLINGEGEIQRSLFDEDEIEF